MPAVPCTRTALAQLLRDNGPMSTAELTTAIELPRSSVSSALLKARRRFGSDVFRIVAWGRQSGRGGREIPIYDLGPGPDAPRPVLGEVARRETQLRYAKKMRMVINAKQRVRRGKQVNPYLQLIKD